MKIPFVLFVLCAIIVGGCSTFTTPRYGISADNNIVLKSLGVTSVGVGTFSGPATIENSCRGLGPVTPPDSMTFAGYFKKALEDELKIAGIFSAQEPRVILSGVLTKLEFSSYRGMTGGSWDIELTISSSNGRSMKAVERYEFDRAIANDTACKQVAEAFYPAVQNLIGNIVRSPEFPMLVR